MPTAEFLWTVERRGTDHEKAVDAKITQGALSRTMSIHYRPEIDGLRAIAVGSVVLYHAGFSTLSGGFVGVDIFFVISGYLITSILLKDLDAGQFSYRKFYERRARRILPALIVVLIATVCVSPFALMPSQFDHVPFEALSALLFVSNIYLWTQSGYFMPTSGEYPLLHMWSLGIEEQFYIFAPLALWSLYSHDRKKLILCAVMIFALSFGLSVWQTPLRPSFSFYMLPTRAWELLAGSLLALGCMPNARQTWVNEIGAAFGLTLIVGSLFLIDTGMAFPGWVAAAPVAGTALVIAFSPGTWVARVLSLRPIVALGLISYSLYLWHWPVLVLGKQAWIIETTVDHILAIALALVLSWASWRCVEQPFRKPGLVSAKVLKISLTTATASVLVLVAFANPAKTILYSTNQIAYDQARFDRSTVDRECFINRYTRVRVEDLCVLGAAGSQIAVWGDSHSPEIALALSDFFSVVKISHDACSPLLPKTANHKRPHCKENNAKILNYLLSSQSIETVVISTRGEFAGSTAKRRKSFSSNIKVLQDSGKKVLVVAPVPTPGFDVPVSLARGFSATYPRVLYEESRYSSLALMSEIQPDAIFYPSEHYCDEMECRLLTEKGKPVLYDSDHMSLSAARDIALELVSIINSLEGR